MRIYFLVLTGIAVLFHIYMCVLFPRESLKLLTVAESSLYAAEVIDYLVDTNQPRCDFRDASKAASSGSGTSSLAAFKGMCPLANDLTECEIFQALSAPCRICLAQSLVGENEECFEDFWRNANRGECMKSVDASFLNTCFDTETRMIRQMIKIGLKTIDHNFVIS